MLNDEFDFSLKEVGGIADHLNNMFNYSYAIIASEVLKSFYTGFLHSIAMREKLQFLI